MLMGVLWVFHRYLNRKMVIWKECELELDDPQVVNDPMTVRALRECGVLKYLWFPRMRDHVRLLDYLIQMWDPYQQHFQAKTHVLTIDVRDIYFLTGLSRRGILISLTGPKGGDMSFDDLIDEYCAIRTRFQGGKNPIKHIVY